jgi:hypothetical protein
MVGNELQSRVAHLLVAKKQRREGRRTRGAQDKI